MALPVGLLLFCGVLYLVVHLIRQRYYYWRNRNVPTLPSSFPLGNFAGLRHKSVADVSIELYRQMDPKERFYGLSIMLQPTIMITDLDLIKTMLIKDFAYFPDHGVYHNERVDALSCHLFCLEGSKWKDIRSKLSPTFTSGRMRGMFPILMEVSKNFTHFLRTAVGSSGEVDVKDCCARMMIDNIGGCAFGIECNSFHDPDSAFRRAGQLVFHSPRHSQVVNNLLRLYPALGHVFGLKVNHDEVIEFFTGLVERTVAMRENSATKRNDLIDMMLELRAGSNGAALTMNELMAQAFGFFLAGYETSSSNVTFCLYELALNEACQERARVCVQDALQKHGGLTYEALSDMDYLDRCINETLRKYPPLPLLPRLSCKAYKIPGSDLVIPPRMKIHIPVYGIQRDERYYPEPDRFDPDRFAPERIAERHFSTFLPFGEGPRVCIGQRLGVMQSRIGLATILANFRLRPGPRTQIPIVYAKDAILLQSQDEVFLQVEPL
ncbi:probable cytochrome P450 6a13 [Anopheles marshallii]|uniref:probable cytochrome P450 6a13 n=1 Tax=Anopheles marshallii TaxID=1521116 RepID=UPI00237B015A|nr:probable cytochrome P450 6a13 [Anopheles marshallii]